MKQISFAIEVYDHNKIMQVKWCDIVSYDKACQIACLVKSVRSDYTYVIKRIEYVEEVMPCPNH